MDMVPRLALFRRNDKHSGRSTNSERHRFTATFMFSAAGDKCGVHYLFRELTGPETERTWDQLGDDIMDRVYENSSATWDETTVLSFLDAFLLPHIENFGGERKRDEKDGAFL